MGLVGLISSVCERQRERERESGRGIRFGRLKGAYLTRIESVSKSQIEEYMSSTCCVNKISTHLLATHV